jgi:hypothetical protein
MEGTKLKVPILAAVLAWGAMGATPVTVSFTADEVTPNIDIDGVVIAKPGISFTFSNPAHTLRVRSGTGTAQDQFLLDPVIQGNTSIFGTNTISTLGVVFSVPVSFVQFDFGVGAVCPEPPCGPVTMATVTLIVNNSPVLASLDSSLRHPVDAEGRFTYDGGLGPVTSILIAPAPLSPANFTSFSFDNLEVIPVSGPSVSSVPAATPLTLAITAICLAGLTMLLLRQRPA